MLDPRARRPNAPATTRSHSVAPPLPPPKPVPDDTVVHNVARPYSTHIFPEHTLSDNGTAVYRPPTPPSNPILRQRISVDLNGPTLTFNIWENLNNSPSEPHGHLGCLCLHNLSITSSFEVTSTAGSSLVMRGWSRV